MNLIHPTVREKTAEFVFVQGRWPQLCSSPNLEFANRNKILLNSSVCEPRHYCTWCHIKYCTRFYAVRTWTAAFSFYFVFLLSFSVPGIVHETKDKTPKSTCSINKVLLNPLKHVQVSHNLMTTS